jgi:ADP-L-glycero-D-manno-heptose 6-epimerase
MIVVTGAAGFIGYNVFESLHFMFDIVAVDNNIERLKNKGFHNITYLTVEDSYLWLEFNAPKIEYVIHLGARTDTAEQDVELFNRLNLNYSKFIWNFCTENQIPLIYASSAAVYGDGSFRFSDDDDPNYEWDYYPLNPYGESKYWFDNFVINQAYEATPPFWAGLRFFNVYGPHEDHKGRMASVVWHFYNQIKETGGVKLFKSHKEFCEDGEQMRDFIYVRDIVSVILWFVMGKRNSGIYNIGTGKARSYNDLAKAIFRSLVEKENIQYIDMPEDIRESYQYWTEAEMDKLRKAGYTNEFRSLEDGIDEYITLLEDENC